MKLQEIFKPDLKFEAVINNFDRDSGICVAMYNASNYATAHEAQAEGALYCCSSEISLYGSSGLFDVDDMLCTILECVGADKKDFEVVVAVDGYLINIDTLIEELDE